MEHIESYNVSTELTCTKRYINLLGITIGMEYLHSHYIALFIFIFLIIFLKNMKKNNPIGINYYLIKYLKGRIVKMIN